MHAVHFLAFGLNCYYGITDDSEDDPEDDWDELCNYEEDDPLVPEEGCKVSCDGPNAACFKIKFSENILSSKEK